MGAKTIVWSLCKPAGKRSSRETPHPRALRCAGHGRGAAPPGVCFLLGRSCMTGALVRLLPAGRRLAVILAILAACPAFALHRESPPAIRLTSGGPNFVPQTRSWAFSLIFSSTDDVLANGSTGRQIYYFTRFDYDCQRGVIPAIERVPVTVLLQITNGAGPSTRPMLDYLGKFISFESTADLLGDGHHTGVSQIFASELEHGKPPFSSRLIQITRGDAPSHHPWIAEKDHFVLFDSAATDLPGAAGGGGTEIYAAPIDAGNSPTVVQYTTANPFGNCTFPTFSPGTTRFAFLCTGDAFANGTAGNRVFAFDAGANQLFQITGRGDVVGPISAAVGHNFVPISDNTDVNVEDS